MKQTQFRIVGVAATVLIALAACGGAPVVPGGTAAEIPNSGFLSDYSKLKPVDGMGGTFRYVDAGANLRPYNKVLIEPVKVLFTPNPDYKDVPSEAFSQMAEAFRMEFVGALLSGYHVVDKPGPEVLRVRLAITGVQPARPELGATDFIPIKAVFNVARSAAGSAPQVAEMTGEAEILDPTGRVVGAAVSTRKADKALPQGERITWKDMQVIAAAWAKGLRQQFDYARGYSAK